jgi:GSH-dependent disulfide-bond oxidoreductase
MITLYSWPTPNHYKVTCFLREAHINYDVQVVHIGKGEQFSSDYLKICPNNKIPALTDASPSTGTEPLTLFESGCILEYLADKTGLFLAPIGQTQRYEVLKWLYWQMAGLGPMLGQNHHFSQYASEKIPYAIQRYLNETKRLYTVLDHQIANKDFVVGNSLSLADFAIYPWIVPHEKQGQNLNDYPNIKKWFERLTQRPAFQQAYQEGALLKGGQETVTEESKSILFGQSGQQLRSQNKNKLLK